MGRPGQNYEICYLKWKIAMEKSIWMNFIKISQKLFSTVDTTFGATCSFTRVNSVLKKKKCQNNYSYAIELVITLIVSMVVSPLPKTAADIKIGAVSSKFCLVSCGVIFFLVSLILFE